MKRKTLVLLSRTTNQKHLLLLVNLFVILNGFAQKIPKSKVDLMFKTPAYWRHAYDQKLKLAPADVVQKIQDFNGKAAAKGYTFELAYTSVFAKPVSQITGGRIPDLKNPQNLPRPDYDPMPPQRSLVNITATVADPVVDMREFGIVTAVRNQNPCGSCWAFASLASFETATLLKNGGDASALDLAEQQIVNCTGTFNSCGGGYNTAASAYICDHRIAPQASYQYTARDSVCGMGNNISSNYKGRRWGLVGGNTAEIKRAIIEHGSVASCVWVSDELAAYGGGVYNLNNQPTLLSTNHVIQIVGWDDNRQAWLIKNSWGDGWGEGGFAWIRYGTNNIGLYTTWIEAESFGTMNPVTNNPHQTTAGGLNFATADYNTLEGLYTKASKYRIINRQSGKVLDCDDPVGLAAINNPNKGRRIQQWDSHNRETLVSSDGFNQEWFFTQAGKRAEKPVYKIFNNGFTNFLTDNNSGRPVCENGNTSDNQLWCIMPQGSKSTVKIKNLATGKFITVPAGNNSNGAEILMAAETAGDNQLFDLNITNYNPSIPLDVKYALVPQHNAGMALDVPGGNAADGAQLQVWQRAANNGNQIWKLSFDGNTGYFQVHPTLAEAKSLEVLNISMENSARTGLWNGWNGRNQEWLVIRLARDPEKFIFFNRNSGKCLDVAGAGSANGTAVNQYEYVNGNNQKWQLLRN